MRGMNIGIDPGLSCGWAVLDESGARVSSGVWNLKPTPHEGKGMRVVRFQNLFRSLVKASPPRVVAFELVKRHKGTDAAHTYGALIGALMAECERMGLAYVGVPVGTVKKQATGKGNAGKPAMEAAATSRWGAVQDDNEADALWVAECARLGVF